MRMYVCRVFVCLGVWGCVSVCVGVRVGAGCVWGEGACGCVCVPGTKNTNISLIPIVRENIFFVWGKTYNGTFVGIFRGSNDLFDHEIALSYAQDNLQIKKGFCPHEKSLEMLHSVFSREKKSPAISESAVH